MSLRPLGIEVATSIGGANVWYCGSYGEITGSYLGRNFSTPGW